MPTTHEGMSGRVVGVLWGVVWIATGAICIGLFLLEGGLARSVLGLLGVVFSVAGLLHVRSAVLESEYSITFREGP